MATLTLGRTPPTLTVWLTDAAPFADAVTADPGWPAAPELVFDDGTVWPATLDGATASWHQAAATVGALVEQRPRRVTLRDPGSHHVWAHGSVHVSRVVDHGDASLVVPGGTVESSTTAGVTSIVYNVTGGTVSVSSVGGVLTISQEA